MSRASVAGSFTGIAASSRIRLWGDFNASLSGFGEATVALERSFDNGATWLTVETFSDNAEKQASEIEDSVLYRLNCTAFTSGPIVYRLSR